MNPNRAEKDITGLGLSDLLPELEMSRTVVWSEEVADMLCSAFYGATALTYLFHINSMRSKVAKWR